jgi:hypothetical protein
MLAGSGTYKAWFLCGAPTAIIRPLANDDRQDAERSDHERSRRSIRPSLAT